MIESFVSFNTSYYIMGRLKSFLLLFLAVVAGVKAQNLLDGYTRVFYADDLKEGKAYFIISDRTKFAGNNTGKPKAMSIQLDSYKVKWGTQYVYWGDFDANEEGFQWIAEKDGDDQWAFKNKVNGQYLGRESGSDNDVLFSATPVGYTLKDLEDGEGRFYMISSEDSRSPHVQGFVRSDRPNNCLAKQDVGITSYVDDVETNGYPARWQLYEVDSTPVETWITDVSQIKEGDQYYLISDRTKFAGSTTVLPKAMACLQSTFKINWGDQYVYWGDLDKESDGFIWTAEKVGDEGQWAFLNKEETARADFQRRVGTLAPRPGIPAKRPSQQQYRQAECGRRQLLQRCGHQRLPWTMETLEGRCRRRNST